MTVETEAKQEPRPELFRRARFRFEWRSYQVRVLDAIDAHLHDGHLHLVAPPGSGKTVLGLEVILRLGRPALVLVPTLTIREQWLHRLAQDFLTQAPGPTDISSDILEPAALTVSTYQAFYTLTRNGQSGQAVIALRKMGVATLVVDEAHHLRSQWWRSLRTLKSALPGVSTVALTGTPPYDAPQVEWNRYASFCGEVDEEIGVPELVQDGTLCPHQDYVYLCTPSEKELAELRRFHEHAKSLILDLSLDTDLADLLSTDPRVSKPDAHLDEILRDTSFWLSLGVFLYGLKFESVTKLLRAMGLKRARLPVFDANWAEVLLNGLLFDDQTSLPGLSDRLRELQRRLGNIGAIERRSVRFRDTRRNRRLLQSGRGMLRSISEIVEVESREQDHRMRLVILSDHIREDALPTAQDEEKPYTKLGVVPIFETLRRLRLNGVRLTILTGSLVVVPADCMGFLRTGAEQHGIPFQRLRLRPLWHAPQYLRIQFADTDRQRAVQFVTGLFADGLINTIVGTAALLGEGWDAPSINTLILASVVSTYVTSNQMRGRALRSLENDPHKVANIWHLACMEPMRDDPANPPGPLDTAPQDCEDSDLQNLRQRFQAFVGLSLEQPVLESGVERLGLHGCSFTETECRRWNTNMVRHAGHRDQLAERWTNALGPPTPGLRRVVRELRLDPRRLRPGFLARFGVPVGGGAGRALFGWWHDWRARVRLSQIGRAVAGALAELKLISASRIRSLATESEGETMCRIYLPTASHLDQARFVEALSQVFDPLSSPRYLMRYRGGYYALPAACGENRSRADVFNRQWRKYIGRAQLIFTHNKTGKLHLLRAKEQALAEFFNYRVETRMRWQ